MKNIMDTERLFLREFILSDAQKLFELNSDPEVIKYTGDSPFLSIQEAKTFLENYADYKKNGYGRWAVILKSTNEFIGWCGLKYNEENFVDIGFRLFKKKWHKGYAYEAAIATLEYGFNILNMDEIIGRVSKDNIASIRVLEKLNMSFWKIDKCYGIKNAVYYRITINQYKSV